MELGVEAIGKDEISPGGEQLGATPSPGTWKERVWKENSGPLLGPGGCGRFGGPESWSSVEKGVWWDPEQLLASGFCSWEVSHSQQGGPRGGQILEPGGEFLQVLQPERPSLLLSHREASRESQRALKKKGRRSPCGKSFPQPPVRLRVMPNSLMDRVPGPEEPWGRSESPINSFTGAEATLGLWTRMSQTQHALGRGRQTQTALAPHPTWRCLSGGLRER